MIGQFADAVTRGVGDMTSSVTDVFDPTLRLGVTGLSRAGKTVFITSLVANLIDRGRMPAFSAGARIDAAFLQPQPDDAVPRFDYEAHLAALTARDPHWPEGTRAISELRLSMKVRRGGMLSGLRGLRTVHLDIVDYPGEWLLDLGLMERSYEDWSERALARLAAWEVPYDAASVDGAAKLEEPQAQRLARDYTAAMQAARTAGAYDLTPGRFLLPGEMAGSPALTFAPLPPGEAPRGSLRREMARRFEAYKRHVVQPFFRDHFARLDRQVVLLDVLGAIRQGPHAVEEMRAAIADVLSAFKPGALGWLMQLLGARRVDRILFAATKADHLHHTQHARLTAILEAMVKDAKARADFAGARTQAISMAALRATVEETREHEGRHVALVRGRVLEDGMPGREVALHPGDLPDDPAHILTPARRGARTWPEGDYDLVDFAPAPLTLRRGEGPPHVRLDRAAEFLLSDRL
ncbi:putative ATPase [Jannaschia seosinensis]|uniref:Putative ATPase n=1 Tax=Jannaschia seosinensis TaxID=313367 RepID=A0A0M7B8L0_9RHOB|nr:YcjX family protein [Jannaschia seosinensis]CUH14992.1 putative ATPase [Jannaschia seosinensis]